VKDQIIEYQIEWMVPSINAVGGQAYWTHLIGGDTDNEDDARILYQKTIKNYNGRMRLVKIFKEIILER